MHLWIHVSHVNDFPLSWLYIWNEQQMPPACHAFLSFLGHIKIISTITVLCGGVSKTCRTWPLMKENLPYWLHMRYQLSLYLIYSGFTETKAKIGLILEQFYSIFLNSSRMISYVHTFTKSVSCLKDTISSVNLPNRYID